MSDYRKMTKEMLLAEKAKLEKSYADFKALGLKLNMARGKPGPHQMDLAMDLLKMSDYTTEDGTDARNYGNLEGLQEARVLFGEVMGVKPENVFVGGNSSLQLMYNLVAIGYTFGFQDSPCPWSAVEKPKFLCPVPGYDRHFRITEEFGIEMINIPMTPTGPDMDMVEKLVAEDASIKGIWCVPQYSNPDGYTYSDETVRRFASMKTAAPDFKIFWDEAYIVHHLTDEIIETPVLLEESRQYGNEDRVFMFTSTSKITFPGAGVSALACSENSMKYVCKRFEVMIISYDKMNQLRHVRFLKNKAGVLAHMQKHRRRLVPCFDAVKCTLAHELTPCGDIAHWTNPKGGYFISLYVMPGCAKRVAELCKQAGLVLTGAGAAYPYGRDPEDSHLRIAPTYPSLDEVEKASLLLTVCVRLAVVEKLLAEQE
ncbi:aminotransferase [uncultured Gemmiger sp.]|uniref:aminotransferase n=1 Tax=uncultured Gemmiger sp. TaxID=1623490 RepID=UPI0025ED93DE|nr:aminotransferase [uncultured Gemmiger sp.]